MEVTFNQLRYFCELAKVGHFGRAADRLYMSQPPLSRQIAALERDLGTKLFDRLPKGVVLTPAGRQLLEDGTEILQLVAQAKRNVGAAGRGETGRLTMGFTMCAAYSVVPHLTRQYKTGFPDVDLRVRELLPNALESDLRDGVIDIAISFPGTEPTEFQTRPLLREPLDVVLPRRHPLARARQLRVEDLAKEQFLIVPRSQVASLHDSIVQRCHAAGFAPTIALEVYLQQTILNFVAEGLGVAFVPASMRRSQIEGAVFKPVPDPPVIDQVLLWSTANKNPCLTGFLSTCGQLPPTQSAG
jgi:DNA-binding transcriptional LysR family regulator